jgi:hypothetical protein
MKSLATSFSKLLVVGMLSTSAGAKTYSCTAVDKKASLGVSDSASVSVTTGDKTCQFSVDGSSVNGKTTAEFRGLLNRVLDSRASALGKQDIEALQFLIMGPVFSGGSVSFRNSFGNVANDLGRCLQSRGQQSVENHSSGLLCKMFRSDDLKRRSFSGVSVESNGSLLVISATIDRQTHLLFIPSTLFQLADGGFRFR